MIRYTTGNNGKKKICGLLVLIVTMLSLLCACTKTDKSWTVPENTTDTPSKSDQETMNEDMGGDDVESVTNEDEYSFAGETVITDEMFKFYATSEWQLAYKKLLEDTVIDINDPEYAKYMTQSYGLYDIDGNGIPELFLKEGTCEADYMFSIFTFNEGELKLVGENLPGGHTLYYTYPDKNGFIYQNAHMGYSYVGLCYLVNDEIIFDSKPVFEEDISAKLETDVDAFYTDVSEIVPKATPITLNFLNYTYGLIEYVNPLKIVGDLVKADIIFEDMVSEVLGTRRNFYGVYAQPLYYEETLFGGDMGMLCLYERDGLFDTDGETCLEQLSYDDFDGDGQEEALAVFMESEFGNIATILFDYQNDTLYGYISSEMTETAIKAMQGKIYACDPYDHGMELKYKYCLNQCVLERYPNDMIFLSEAGEESVTLFRQDMKADDGDLAVLYIGNAGVVSGNDTYGLLRDIRRNYSDEQFFTELNKLKCIRQPGDELYLLVPGEADYSICVYEQLYGEDTYDGMPDRGRLLYKGAPGELILVKGNQSEIVSNIEISMDMKGKELIYHPQLSMENGKVSVCDGVIDITRW